MLCKRRRQSTAASRTALITCPECDAYDNHPAGGVRSDTIYGKGKHMQKRHLVEYRHWLDEKERNQAAQQGKRHTGPSTAST